ncbi:MAG: N-(5'-phosphoribosyl)anthranilate isomerase [Candidatus Neomarinimicrobiota bacterium]|nr:MAG: N-(5'-phosphoribosyl)anthranilate isomerase [Candidatus Neomarinimicrobiota bacterium]
MRHTLVKICGITNIDDALMTAEFGADALGFVFAESVRNISPEVARKIVKRLPPFITTVGVFMDQEINYVNKVTDYTGIDVVQLHGEESTEYCKKINRRIIKRIKIDTNDTSETLFEKMKPYSVSAFLLDPGAGSGRTFDWSKAFGIDLSFIIAGGLTPENVRKVVHLLKPYGVDVSSGVEKSPGKKDGEKIARFIRETK